MKCVKNFQHFGMTCDLGKYTLLIHSTITPQTPHSAPAHRTPSHRPSISWQRTWWNGSASAALSSCNLRKEEGECARWTSRLRRICRRRGCSGWASLKRGSRCSAFRPWGWCGAWWACWCCERLARPRRLSVFLLSFTFAISFPCTSISFL